jgi:hypothetical protein
MKKAEHNARPFLSLSAVIRHLKILNRSSSSNEVHDDGDQREEQQQMNEEAADV